MNNKHVEQRIVSQLCTTGRLCQKEATQTVSEIITNLKHPFHFITGT